MCTCIIRAGGFLPFVHGSTRAFLCGSVPCASGGVPLHVGVVLPARSSQVCDRLLLCWHSCWSSGSMYGTINRPNRDVVVTFTWAVSLLCCAIPCTGLGMQDCAANLWLTSACIVANRQSLQAAWRPCAALIIAGLLVWVANDCFSLPWAVHHPFCTSSKAAAAAHAGCSEQRCCVSLLHNVYIPLILAV